jgi:hypothetical protein
VVLARIRSLNRQMSSVSISRYPLEPLGTWRKPTRYVFLWGSRDQKCLRQDHKWFSDVLSAGLSRQRFRRCTAQMYGPARLHLAFPRNWPIHCVSTLQTPGPGGYLLITVPSGSLSPKILTAFVMSIRKPCIWQVRLAYDRVVCLFAPKETNICRAFTRACRPPGYRPASGIAEVQHQCEGRCGGFQKR